MPRLEADQAAADREEGFVDVVATFLADAEMPILVQPGDRPLDDPSLLAEPGAALFGQAIFAWMPRWRSSLRPLP